MKIVELGPSGEKLHEGNYYPLDTEDSLRWERDELRKQLKEAMNMWTQERAKNASLRAALESYSEWLPEEDEDGAWTGWHYCLSCLGTGKFNMNDKASKRYPPEHKPDCKRMLALKFASSTSQEG